MLSAEPNSRITGDIGNPMEGKDLRLNVALAAKSSVPLSELAGVDVEEVGPLNVKLTVIEKNGRFDLGNINMTAQPRHAHVTIKGSVIDIVDNPQPNVDVALSAKTLTPARRGIARCGTGAGFGKGPTRRQGDGHSGSHRDSWKE